MSKISYTPELNSKPNKAGKYAILIRITKDRKSKRVAIGVEIDKKDWNPTAKNVRLSHPNAKILNALITKKIAEAEVAVVNDEVVGRKKTIKQLQKQLRNESTGGSFHEFAQSYIDNMRNSDTADAYRTVTNKLLAFAPELDFFDINYTFLAQYERHLSGLGNGQNTRTKNLSTIRTIFREAVKMEVFEPTNDPFLRIKFKKEKVNRLRLSLDEIEKLTQYQGEYQAAKNIFLLQYFASGVRIADMLMMRWSNLKSDHLEYIAQKTGKLHNPKLPPIALQLLKAIKPAKMARNEYIFPFLKKYKWATDKDRRTEISCRTATINLQLKKIMADLGINKAASTHTARHSFAQNARVATNNDIYAVSKSLGHSHVTTTEQYFSADNRQDTDKVTDALFGK